MMTPVYLNPASSPFSMVEQAEDQRLKLFISPPYDEAASCTSFPFPTFFSLQDQTPGTTFTSLAHHQSQLYHHKDKNIWDCGTSYDQASSSSSLVQAHVGDAISNKDRRLSRCGDHERETNIGGGGGEGGEEEGKSSNYITSTRPKSVKWMSSKMRLMQKMTSNNPDLPPGTTDHIPAEISEHKFQIHTQPRENSETSFSSNSNNTAAVRVCSDCHTNSTPLWRSGPLGPKSLCNACGIRQRKARRAMAEAEAAAANGFSVGSADTSTPKGKVAKEKKSRGSHKNKISKLIITDNASLSHNNKKNNNNKKKICFKALDFQRVFPQDVAEAAMLLMELSCGLINNHS
ncbi:hypothetical protein ACE6H2_004176 [Prunus campanulata]